ncbi:MAG: hypothetical protein ACLSHC_04425 [Bilophila wadsworthia]
MGESGCGKSVLCKSVMKLLPGNARISGKMLIDGKRLPCIPKNRCASCAVPCFPCCFRTP